MGRIAMGGTTAMAATKGPIPALIIGKRPMTNPRLKVIPVAMTRADRMRFRLAAVSTISGASPVRGSIVAIILTASTMAEAVGKSLS
jgi:hypothetical protein